MMDELIAVVGPAAFQAFGTVLGALVVAIAGYVVRYLNAKVAGLNLRIDDARRRQLRGLAMDVAMWTEEKMANVTSGDDTPSKRKMDEATAELIRRVAVSPSIKDIGIAEAVSEITTVLPSLGLGAAAKKVKPVR